MAMERREISGDTPCLGWLWGLLLTAAVVVIGVVVPPAILLLLGADRFIHTMPAKALEHQGIAPFV